ncbi:MAG: hypothetical protein PHF25_06050 [Candidatus Margulisbacteria bacterium]|nr:hypothetical protein [Candidatus Margulisiibacteriota bacterium]
MSLKNNSTFTGLVFIFFFVLQQIIIYVYTPYKYFFLYRLIITLITLLIGLNLPLTKKQYHLPLIFMIICVFGSFFSFFNGTPLGGCISKSFFALCGYIGFVYISERKINLRLFDYVLVILYLLFYITYFSLEEYTRNQLDGYLYGKSSSNTIAISLNIVLFIYYLLSKSYKENIKYKILLFSLINIALIVIQGSRAGVAVAFILTILVISDIVYLKFKRFYASFLIVILITFVFIYLNIDKLGKIVDVTRMQGIKSLQEDVRGRAQLSFFVNMDLGSFLFGYPSEYEFTHEITRTFNAFLDFWNRFGFIPFFFLFVFLLRRIIKYRNFSISFIYLIPIIFYSMVESLWGATSWDILIYLSIFYSIKLNKNYVSNNFKVAAAIH